MSRSYRPQNRVTKLVEESGAKRQVVNGDSLVVAVNQGGVEGVALRGVEREEAVDLHVRQVAGIGPARDEVGRDLRPGDHLPDGRGDRVEQG